MTHPFEPSIGSQVFVGVFGAIAGALGIIVLAVAVMEVLQ